jgi:branched-chain amino acid transport system permease protein
MLQILTNVSQKKRDAAMGIFIIITILMVSIFSSDSVVDFMSRMVVYMLFAVAVNIILGFGGLRPLGQGTFFGFAAYAYLFLVVRMHLSIGAALPLAILLSIVLAVFIGYVTLRANDDLAFAFMNMGINIMLWTMVQKLQIVGSDTGITGAVRLPFATSTKANFMVIFIVSSICIFLIYQFRQSPFAKVLKGSRENLERLTFLGINTRNVRLVAYVISSFFCSIAGLLYSMRNMGAFPVMISSGTSMDAMIMCLMGGMYSFFGPVLGAAIITAINSQLPIVTKFYQAIEGVMIVLCVLFLQGGIIRDKVTLNLGPGSKGINQKKELSK